MIPSRGIQWSSRAIGTGRRCLEDISIRSFSSSTTHNARLSAAPFARSALSSKTAIRPQFASGGSILKQISSKRFQSTAPVTTAAATSTPPADTVVTAAATSTPTTNAVAEASSSAAFPTSIDSAIDLSTNIHDVPEHIGYLKTLDGLDFGWGPTAGVEWALEHIHVLLGTPWWASIAITAIAFRVILLKPYMDAADNAAKIAAVSPITKPLQAKMTELSRTKETTAMMTVRREIQTIHQRAGIKMWKSFVPMLQMFLGYGTFVLLRAMGKLPVPGLETGGLLWFQNLALPDPMFILPLATAGILHLVLRRGGETGVNTMSDNTIKLMSYGLPAVTVLFTWWLPSGLQFSFLISGVLSACQATMFRMPGFRSYFGMTPLPPRADPFAAKEALSPYRRDILTAQQMKERYETPDAKGVLSALTDKVKDVKETARKGVKGMKEYAGQERKDGKRTKAEIQKAEAYEKKRQREEKERIAELDRRAREQRRLKKLQKEQGKK